jgi:cell division protein FtsN
LAALDSAADAETMVQRLKAARIDAWMSKGSAQGKTWYRVLVRHRGGVETALEFKENLKKNGFTDIVLRSRQPLDTPKN